MNVDISNLLEALQTDLGARDQTELAVALGISASTISRWRNGLQIPREKALSRVIAGAGLNPSDYGFENSAISPVHVSRSEAPTWFTEQINELLTRIEYLTKLVETK
jgi:transcriptional regulator with XRE-family HTH domain